MSPPESPQALLTQELLKQVCAEKGHSWQSDGRILTSNPPQYPETCKICGAHRVGVPNEPLSYYYPDQNAH